MIHYLNLFMRIHLFWIIHSILIFIYILDCKIYNLNCFQRFDLIYFYTSILTISNSNARVSNYFIILISVRAVHERCNASQSDDPVVGGGVIHCCTPLIVVISKERHRRLIIIIKEI